jgi:hypothetical protein
MFPFILSILSFLGFLATLCIHILAWCGYTNPILLAIAIPTTASALLVGIPGVFIFPSDPPVSGSWSKRTGHNFLRRIPQKAMIVIRLAAIYGFGIFLVGSIFFKDSDGFPRLLAITGWAIALYAFFWIGYWYHSPVEIRDDFWSMFKSKKHLKRHRKHDIVGKE